MTYKQLGGYCTDRMEHADTDEEKDLWRHMRVYVWLQEWYKCITLGNQMLENGVSELVPFLIEVKKKDKNLRRDKEIKETVDLMVAAEESGNTEQRPQFSLSIMDLDVIYSHFVVYGDYRHDEDVARILQVIGAIRKEGNGAQIEVKDTADNKELSFDILGRFGKLADRLHAFIDYGGIASDVSETDISLLQKLYDDLQEEIGFLDANLKDIK